jgi:hypothetical protein
MLGREKPHRTNTYKEIMNGWNYDANCTLALFPVSDFDNFDDFKRLIFVAQSVHSVQIF